MKKRGNIQMEEKKINGGSSCLLVKDQSLLDGWEAPIYKWLKEEGFVTWGKKGVFSGVDWIYINLETKIFAPGMPGVPLASVFGNHAITLEEFMTMYDIYKKYEGLAPLKMSHDK